MSIGTPSCSGLTARASLKTKENRKKKAFLHWTFLAGPCACSTDSVQRCPAAGITSSQQLLRAPRSHVSRFDLVCSFL